jgi:hypothetical protein
MLNYIANPKRPLDFYIHVGDMAYSQGTDAQFSSNFFKPYESTLRSIACWPTMGNHEGATSRGESGVGPYYDAYVCPTRAEAGGVASGTEAYYSFDYANAHFICLDSHDLDRRPTGAMMRWLKSDLEMAKADWLLAFWHHPPYSKGSHDSDREEQLIEMRMHVMPLLEASGVDVVLTGHSHIYERSMLMDGAYSTPTIASGVIFDDGDGDPSGDGAYRKSAGLQPHEGTVQVVAGHGGAELGRTGSMPVMKRVMVEHGSVIIDVEGNTLSAIMLNVEGQRRDLFSIVKKGKVTPVRILEPWQLPPWDDGIELPRGFKPLVQKNAEWDYLAGNHPSGSWTSMEFQPVGWVRGLAGFGSQTENRKTKLDMTGRYTAVYIRTTFNSPDPTSLEQAALVLKYDDGFIAYLNGKEFARAGVASGSAESASGITPHGPTKYELFGGPELLPLLRKGENVLAIEGHNTSMADKGFTLDPYFIAVPKKIEGKRK